MKRPTLANHVAVRRHRVGDTRLVVLHDARAVATVGEREWTVLQAADGTRDSSGIAAACAAAGRQVRDDHVADFLGELERAGMLREGAPQPPQSLPSPAGRPVVALEDFRLRCDGSGTCCRIYPTTLFSALEVARAHSLSAIEPGATFTPELGSTLAPWLGRAVAMVDGRCAFLAPDGACTLHRAGGAAGKPSGCRMYPAVFVDDGSSLRASVVPECRCAFASARAPSAEGTLLGSMLEPSAHVEALPAELPLTGERTIERERANALCDAIAAEASDDAVALLDAVAAELGHEGSLERELARLGRRLEQHEAHNAWRSAGDFARAVPRWMRAALDRRDGAADRAGERFYLRASAFARSWLRAGEPPLAEGLRRRAARLWIARRLRGAIDEDDPLASDPAVDEPLALVEAVCRSFAL